MTLNMKSKITTHIKLAALFMMVLASHGVLSAATVTAQLDRASVAVGKAAVLNITIKGDGDAKVILPEIDGLMIESRGHSRNIQIMNGQMNSSITKRYIVVADHVGEFEISPITVVSRGKKLTVKNKPKLKVTKTQAVQQGNPNGHQNPAAPQDIKPEDFAKLEIIGLKDEAIVGEVIPLEIRAYFKNSNQVSLAQIKSKPELDGSSFTFFIVRCVFFNCF